jgi:hypothetical protein
MYVAFLRLVPLPWEDPPDGRGLCRYADLAQLT